MTKKYIGALIKPSSSKCNLKCRYCFYHTIADEREVRDYGFMDDETMENLIKKLFDFASGGSVSIAFQGGEPTLIGIHYFEKFVKYVDKYNTLGAKVIYAIQTNGTLITEEWAKFFSKNKFLVGLSLDGPEEINDYYRVDSENKGSFNQIMKTKELFDKYSVEYNILVVVSSLVAKNIKKIYNFFKLHNFNYLQFIPCLDPLVEGQGGNIYSLKPNNYEYFLKELFDLWFEDLKKNKMISIRFFDNLLKMHLEMEPEACSMRGMCHIQNVIEADGTVYPCDFYTYEKDKLGNINESSFTEILENKKSIVFVRESIPANHKSVKCEWYKFCKNGCRRYRDTGDSNSKISDPNYYCNAYKSFYSYTNSRFEIISKAYRAMN